MLPVYLSLAGVLVVLCVFLIIYFSDPKAPLYAKALVFLSFLSSLVCFLILPIDIYQSSLEYSERLPEVQTAWLVIYYINFFLCWFILPLAQEYEDSGEFSFAKKAKESLLMNGILIGLLCGGAVIMIIYLLVASSFTFDQLPGVFATLVNVFGLTLVTVLMGYGLLSLPKECFQRRDYKSMVNVCHRQAEALKAEQETILQQIFTIRQILDNDTARDAFERREVLALIHLHFKFHNYRGEDSQNAEALKKKSTADLHKIVKKRALENNACASQLDELVDELKGVTESYLHNNYRNKKIYYTITFILTTLMAAFLFFAELAAFASFLQPANLLRLLGWSGIASYVLNVLLTAYVAHSVANAIFRIKVYKVFALHRGHSSASSLLFTAINLSRVCYPLCFNYLQIINSPPSSFLNFFGQVSIPHQYAIIFPILMVVFALFNAFDLYDRVVGYLGLASYAFDDEQAQQKKQEGRSILIERFKERNLQNNQLEMIQLL